MRKTFLLLAAILLASAGCSGSAPAEAVYQYAPIQLLMDGHFDGVLTVAELRRHGQIGLGTFDGLDGELILVDGQVYQARVDGRTSVADGNLGVPFAVAAPDRPQQYDTVGPMSLESLQTLLQRRFEPPGAIYAVRIDGRFESVKFRSVPRQRRPYPRLAEAVAAQQVHQANWIDGTIVGFYFPPTLGTANVPGWHLHFISFDRTIGGHLLDAKVERARWTLAGYQRLELMLPAVQPATRPATGPVAGAAEEELRRIEK